MELVFKYFGKSPDPDRKKIFSGEPVNLQEFRNNEMTSFTQVFRNEVSTTVRKARKLFRNGIYHTLSPQLGAFDHLRDMLKNSRYELMNITRASFKKDEALYRVQVLAPVEPAHHEQLFSKKLLREGAVGQVTISFYLGVCVEFVSLQKPDELNDTLRAALNAAKETPAPDPAFLVENVLPVFLKDNRLEARHNYLHSPERFGNKTFYQLPEGYIYRIEVDGYSSL